jgi:hypothetical protein
MQFMSPIVFLDQTVYSVVFRGSCACMLYNPNEIGLIEINKIRLNKTVK